MVLSAPQQRVEPSTAPRCANDTVEFELHDGTRVARERIVSYVTVSYVTVSYVTGGGGGKRPLHQSSRDAAAPAKSSRVPA